MCLFLLKSFTFLLGKKENQHQDHTWNTCVFALLSPEMTPALCCWSLLICGNIWELLVLCNEAVLPVSPWEGKCYYSHFTGRELQHTGTWCRAELEITFQITGLELLSEVLPSPFYFSDPAVPCSQPSTTGSAPSCSPSHLPLGMRPLNHLYHLGLLRELNGRRHILSATIPDTPACQTLSLLEGTREVGQKNPPWNYRNGFQKCHRDGFPQVLDSSQS